MHSILNKDLASLPNLRKEIAELLSIELNIATYEDFVTFLPLRYEDRSQFHNLNEPYRHLENIQVKGVLGPLRLVSGARKNRLVGTFSDGKGTINLVWFNYITWIKKNLFPGQEYILYSKLTSFQDKPVLVHPELTPLTVYKKSQKCITPIYSIPKNLVEAQVSSSNIAKLQKIVLEEIRGNVEENLPPFFLEKYQLLERGKTLEALHFPASQEELKQAQYRFKLEEIFFLQLRLLRINQEKKKKNITFSFNNHSLLKKFKEHYLPFALTEDQEKALEKIKKDLGSGQQMNRLLQGDVGSGKTIVAFLVALVPIAEKKQVAILVPTEILALQHASTLHEYGKSIGVEIRVLTGSTSSKERKEILADLVNGSIDIIIGTHALLQDDIVFASLGLLIIDEQHRFGVEQRSKLWHKGEEKMEPHVLVMTATPIPRTLAMTLYSGLDITSINSLPPGRLPVKTYHCNDTHRLRLFGFLKKKIEEGRQVYIIYPLIEESSTLDYKYLMDGYESVKRAFPSVQVSILHSKMKAENKKWEMDRFVKGQTKIMVATTVIEVGVNVPNATIMVIENAERFGLAQLHQMRGRIKRGSYQPYCFLMTNKQISSIASTRIQAMVKNDDGFVIAEIDLQLRGPGNLVGIQQSGLAKLRLTDFKEDEELVKIASEAVRFLIKDDPLLKKSENEATRKHLYWLLENSLSWEKIS